MRPCSCSWSEKLVDPGAVAGAGGQGSFRSIAGIRALFASDAGIVIGWTHYLAFDLFVGLWIAKDADNKGFARWVQLSFLAATLLAGPMGLLAWLVTRERRARRAAQGSERALLRTAGERRPAPCPGGGAQCRTHRRSACRLAAAKRPVLEVASGTGEHVVAFARRFFANLLAAERCA